jgi:hypothetical protein
MTQPFIKEITNLDIRRRLVDEKQIMLDEEITPFGIIYDGQSMETNQLFMLMILQDI